MHHLTLGILFSFVLSLLYTSRLVTFNKLKPSPIYATNDWMYFNRIVPLWDVLSIFDLRLSLPTIKKQLKSFFFNYFLTSFNSNNSCSFHFACFCSSCSKSHTYNFKSFDYFMCYYFWLLMLKKKQKKKLNQ